MATDQERHQLQNRLEAVLGPEEAATLMEHLPPHRWDHLATHDDVGRVGAGLDRLEGRMDRLEGRMDRLEERLHGFEQRTLERFASIEGTLQRYDERFDSLRHELVAEFRVQTIQQTRLLFFSIVGAIFTTASLAFAAVRF